MTEDNRRIIVLLTVDYFYEVTTMVDKKERFEKVATARTQKIIDMVRLLGNCSNKSNYTYTPDQVEAIFSTIQREIDLAREKYKIQENKSEDKFKLP